MKYNIGDEIEMKIFNRYRSGIIADLDEANNEYHIIVPSGEIVKVKEH